MAFAVCTITKYPDKFWTLKMVNQTVFDLLFFDNGRCAKLMRDSAEPINAALVKMGKIPVNIDDYKNVYNLDTYTGFVEIWVDGNLTIRELTLTSGKN